MTDYVPVKEDSREWERIYDAMYRGYDPNMTDFLIPYGHHDDSPSIDMNIQGEVRASASAENVEPPSPETLSEPEAYEDVENAAEVNTEMNEIEKDKKRRHNKYISSRARSSHKTTSSTQKKKKKNNKRKSNTPQKKRRKREKL